MATEENKPLEGEMLERAEEDAGENEARVRKGFWKTVVRAGAQIPFMEDVIAGYYCALDPQTPSRVRFILLAALAYFVLPLDTIPDFIIGFGFTDDIAVLGGVLATIRSNIRDEHFDAARRKLAEMGQSGPKKTDAA